MLQVLWECNRRNERPRHFVSGCFKFSWAPPFLTLPKLPTSLIRLPLRLPGNDCPFKAFTRSLACVPRGFSGVSLRSASCLYLLFCAQRRLFLRKEASRNTLPFAAPKLSPLPGRR